MRKLMVLLVAGLAACGDQPEPPAAEAPEPPVLSARPLPGAPTPSAAAAWSGTWLGPEGTSITILASPQGYDITITNLDGPRYFSGVDAIGGIEIIRDGSPLTIRRGTGIDTGMKWLEGKTDCLVVGPNEGYCRG